MRPPIRPQRQLPPVTRLSCPPKLVQLNNATIVGDLVAPLGNRLEALRGDLAGKHSIRISDQWRIVLRWSSQGREEVEIIIYH